MSINRRRHIRLTLDIPVYRYMNTGEKLGVMVYQISIGGCFIEWDDSIKIDDEFRLEIQLPNKNWLPLQCRAIYLMKGDGVGVLFEDITKFEQELLADIMSANLEQQGIPTKIDPFSPPKKYFNVVEKNDSANESFKELMEENLLSVNE